MGSQTQKFLRVLPLQHDLRDPSSYQHPISTTTPTPVRWASPAPFLGMEPAFPFRDHSSPTLSPCAVVWCSRGRPALEFQLDCDPGWFRDGHVIQAGPIRASPETLGKRCSLAFGGY